MRPVRGMKRGLVTGKLLAVVVPLIGAGIALMSKRVRSAAFGKVRDAADNLRARHDGPAPAATKSAPPQDEPVATAAPAPKPRAVKPRKAPAKPPAAKAAAKPVARTRKAPAKPKGSSTD